MKVKKKLKKLFSLKSMRSDLTSVKKNMKRSMGKKGRR